MTIQLIDTGRFFADGGAMFGAVPKTAWSRKYAADKDNRCILSMRSTLIRTSDGKRILIDTGAGARQMKELAYYGFFGTSSLAEELRRRDTAPQQITDVILTHLHFDHCGGCTCRRKEEEEAIPLFPAATYWVSRRQWENFQSPHPLEKDSYFRENMQPIADSGQLKLVEADCTLHPEIDLRLFEGHTPGQLVPYIHHSSGTAVFAGDVVPLAAHLSPSWISAYDLQPQLSYTEKIRLLEEAAREKQAVIYCHDNELPASFIKKVNDFFRPAATVPFISSPDRPA